MEDDVLNECLCQTNPFDEEFLRDILQQPEAEEGGDDLMMMMKNKNSNSSSTMNLCGEENKKKSGYILSFEGLSGWKDVSENSNSTTRSNQGTKKTRSASESMDHIMSERKRRQELTRKFIALASTIPGLKKVRFQSYLYIFKVRYVNEIGLIIKCV